jgi:predicted O-methyltransferase YrrM
MYHPSRFDFMMSETGSSLFFHCVSMYVLIRLLRPEAIVETGGTPGKSSAFALRALERNNSGHLVTIDLPPPEVTSRKVSIEISHSVRPAGTGSNWCVPSHLRRRQTLLNGSSRNVLPAVIANFGAIDLFIHDSEHSYGNMLWELETAYPSVRKGGYLWSDDIETNEAWEDFCNHHELVEHNFASQGVAQKRKT